MSPFPLLYSLALALIFAGNARAQTQTPFPFPGWSNKAATPSASVPATDKDLVGQWESFVSQGDGSNPQQRIARMSLTITPGHVNSTGAGTIGDGTYRISGGAGKLHYIDSTGTGGQYAGKQYQGIFSIEGNTLKWCAGDPGRGRPNSLRTNPAAGYFLMVLTRKSSGSTPTTQ
jgi:uncharacterized protein (TIGR03067 family)